MENTISVKSVLVASSRSRTTEIYQGDNGKLYQVYYFKSGAIEVKPVSSIPNELTVRYNPPRDEGWNFDPNMPDYGIRLPAER